ncbi:uncharacterized protein BYT42DRAFT_62911 [Radiomyces spectabilis]|uniref:uncharacterized protein n=1 Tax=Radiomyces spectabilis TaxID=64574 RepID=UPI0022203969|nr:uncharacterized protein BYT42DRAFT_62911 [Radiomyces spectabilis]KAI8373230.1 hypothetical protein BYT42DRAFT_62911 [Radiomyces spectabilis]
MAEGGSHWKQRWALLLPILLCFIMKATALEASLSERKFLLFKGVERNWPTFISRGATESRCYRATASEKWKAFESGTRVDGNRVRVSTFLCKSVEKHHVL